MSRLVTVAAAIGHIAVVAAFGGTNPESESGSSSADASGGCVAADCGCTSGDCCIADVGGEVCLDRCQAGGPDDCISCIFEDGFDFDSPICPDDCDVHPDGYCGQECGSTYGGTNSQFGCYFCFNEDECLDAGCAYLEGDDGFSCNPPCGPNNCDSCTEDECGAEEMCAWHDEDGECRESCAAGNCDMCEEDECGSSDDCVWAPDEGEWDEGVCSNGVCGHDGSDCSDTDYCGHNLGMCRTACGSDECYSCQGELYGFEAGSDDAIALCEDAGCFYTDDQSCYTSTECDEDGGNCQDVEICESNDYCQAPCVDDEGNVNCDACGVDEDTCEQNGCMWLDTNIVNGVMCDDSGDEYEANYECMSPCGNGDSWDSEDSEGEPRPECWTCVYLGAVEDYCADGCSVEDHGMVHCDEGYMSCS